MIHVDYIADHRIFGIFPKQVGITKKTYISAIWGWAKNYYLPYDWGYPHGLPQGFPEPPDLGTGAASDVSHCAAHLRYGWLGLGPRCGQRWWKCWKSPRNGRKPLEFIGKWWSPLTITIPINSGICLIYWRERWNSSKGSGVEVAKTVRSD